MSEMTVTVDEGRYGNLPCNFHTSLLKGNSWEKNCLSFSKYLIYMRSETGVGVYMKITVFWDVTSCSLVNSHRTTRRHIPEDNIIIFVKHPSYTQKATWRWHATGLFMTEWLCEARTECCLWVVPSNIVHCTMHIRNLILHKGLDSNFCHLESKCEL